MCKVTSGGTLIRCQLPEGKVITPARKSRKDIESIVRSPEKLRPYFFTFAVDEYHFHTVAVFRPHVLIHRQGAANHFRTAVGLRILMESFKPSLNVIRHLQI